MNGHHVRVLADEPRLADRTWIAEGYMVCGPAFVLISGGDPGGYAKVRQASPSSGLMANLPAAK